MTNLVRHSAYSSWGTSSISRQIIPWYTMIPFLVGSISMGNIRFIACKIRNSYDHEGAQEKISGQHQIKNQRNQKKKFQSIDSQGITVEVCWYNLLFLKKTLAFIVGFFHSTHEKCDIRNQDSCRRKGKANIQNVDKNRRQSKDDQTKKPAYGFQHIQTLSIFQLLHQPLKSIFDNRFHLTSLKSLINSTFILTFTTLITK